MRINPIGVRLCIALMSIVLSLSSLSLAQTRVACVGTSITQFFHYPDTLQYLLGSGYTVGNFGLSGADVIRGGNPGNVVYIRQTSTLNAIYAQRPDIVVMEFGANDNDSVHAWGPDSQDFTPGYNALIDTIYHGLGYQPRTFLCLPTAQTTTADGRSDSRILHSIIPRIQQIAALRGLPTIDLYTKSADTSLHLLASDGLHPAWLAGSDTIAHEVYRALTATTATLATPGSPGSTVVPHSTSATPFRQPDARQSMCRVSLMERGKISMTLSGRGRHAVSVITVTGRVLSSATVEGTGSVTLQTHSRGFGVGIVRVDSYVAGPAVRK
jgi:lysophospholipase L1-like esterase